MEWIDPITHKKYGYSWGFDDPKHINKEIEIMSMDDMNRYLENRGFKASRCYDSVNKQHIFVIQKDGHSLERTYKYPFMKSAPFANKDQHDFLHDFVNEFINKFEKEKKEMNKNTLDLITAIRNGKATIEAGGSTASVRILTINHNPGEHITFECELLSGTPYNKMYRNPIPSIKNVIFNCPATIVYWSDGTKTVVKCGVNDWYDPEKGLAMAMAKKALGNQGNYYTEFRKWLKNYVVEEDYGPNLDDFISALWKLGLKLKVEPEETEVEEDLSDKFYTFNDPDIKPEVTIKVDESAPKMTDPYRKPKWEIRYRNAELGTPEEFHNYAYSSKYSAERAARRMFGEPDIGRYRWYVTEI